LNFNVDVLLMFKFAYPMKRLEPMTIKESGLIKYKYIDNKINKELARAKNER